MQSPTEALAPSKQAKLGRINSLTAAQTEQLAVWRDRWIRIGLSTEPADRPRAERGIRACYRAAKLVEPKAIIWVQSPLVGALAAPIAAFVIEQLRAGNSPDLEKVRKAAVDSAVYSAVKSVLGSRWASYRGGSLLVGAIAWSSFLVDVCGLAITEEIAEKLAAWRDTSESAGWWWPFKDFCIVTERPKTNVRDEQGRLHSTTGAAIQWPDGWGLHMWHGVRLPADVIEKPETLTADRIDREENQEVKRAMVSLFGLAKYAALGEVVHQDVDALGFPRKLLRRRMENGAPDLLMVQVKNSSLEPDGSRKDYFLCVHPQIRPLLPDGGMGMPQKATCHNAVASTFGLRGEEYQPECET